MPQKLTKKVVDSAQPGTRTWDSEVKVLGIEVSAKSTKTYFLKYRFKGAQRWITIGRRGFCNILRDEYHF